MVLLQADESASSVGFGSGRKPYGFGSIVESFIEIAEVAECAASEQIGRWVERICVDGLIQKCDGSCRFDAFTALCPVFSRFIEIGPGFWRNSAFDHGRLRRNSFFLFNGLFFAPKRERRHGKP